MSETGGSDIVFVYGALRSGTTLFRLMLDSHPDIDNPGEVDFLFDYLDPDTTHPSGWSYDRERLVADRTFRQTGLALPDSTDGLDLLSAMIAALVRSGKNVATLNVHRHATKIAKVLPESRFIHILRDPRDVARSAVAMGWAGNSYFSCRGWRDTEEAWDRAAVPEERVITVRFEDLMSDLETQLTRVCDFLGVPFDASMLGYHLNSTYDPPDPKVAQQWRRKSTQREVGLIEVEIGPLMATRGYIPEHPRPAPGRIEHGVLWTEHRLKRWLFNMRRFGFALFFGHHMARLLGLNSLEKRLRAQQDEIIIRNRK
ncbi:sulfotransferase family protein [Palleronia sp. KMU-117]|uniref:sulfotransferase family protein n=1 Tax=Palleronia sp. KMU-117 TaxID=3434108 RepID=UPI003D72ED36